MALPTWNDRCLIGMKQVDENHHLLFKLLNIIYEEFGRQVPADNPVALLNALMSLSRCHFRYEERWMAEICFEGLPEHKKEHDIFAAMIAELQQSYSEGAARDAELLSFLDNWTDHHFNSTNKELRDFLMYR